MPFSNNTVFCTTREAAQLLGVSLRTAQLWVESGLLEAWKTDGGHRRIARTSVEKLLAEKPGAAAAATPEQGQARVRILVVEDDSVLLKLYKMRIASWQLPVSLAVAGNGYEGLLRIGRETPDLLILDLHMPGMDGFRMLQTLAYSPFREGMEIVVVTGLSPEEIAERGGVPHGIAVLPKPVPFGQIRAMVETLLAKMEQVECLS